MKEWFKELKIACKTMLCHKLLSWGGVKCEDHRPSILIVSSFFIFLILGGGIGSGFKLFQFGMSFIEDNRKGEETQLVESQTASVGAGIATRNRFMEMNDESGHCGLGKESWNLWLGEMSRDVRDEKYLFLPTKTNQGLFKYGGSYDPSWVCDFVFVPRGENSINYVISFDGIYQIVVGDNDYSSISLRASDTIGGTLNPVEETRTQLTRPRLLSSVKQGSIVNVELKQEFLESNIYKVTLAIDYTPDTHFDIEPETEYFSWEFKPSPSIDLKPLELSIGLIRARNDSTQVGVSFLAPNPDFSPTK